MQQIKDFLNESARLKQLVAETLTGDIQKVIDLIRASYQQGGKLLLMGNGGSAGDAQHIAAELIGRYKRERKAVPAIALTVDTSILTAVGNDYGFENVFSRQVEGLARKEDVVMAISTSGIHQTFDLAALIAEQGDGGGAERLRRFQTADDIF